MKKLLTLIAVATIIITSCKKDAETPAPTDPTPTPSGPNLIFKFHFDSTLARLDNFGNPSTIPVGNAAQTPRFNLIGAHSIEFTTNDLTQLGQGEMVFESPKTTIGGASATDFDQLTTVTDGPTFFSTPLSSIALGSYKWARVALTYQNFDITYLSQGNFYSGTLASFVDDITYINNYTINTQTINVNTNKIQGYWGFETTVLGIPFVFEGQAPVTTVPNPISGTSPIPPFSCVVTGQFPTNLTITGNETQDIIVTFNLSTNNSFEWKDLNGDGFYEPTDGTNPGDTVVDMGIRGLHPSF